MRLAFYFDNQPFLERTKLSEASSLTILSFTVDSCELFYLIFIFYFKCFGALATLEFTSLQGAPVTLARVPEPGHRPGTRECMTYGHDL